MTPMTHGPHWILTVNYDGIVPVIDRALVETVGAVERSVYPRETYQAHVFRFTTRAAALIADSKVRSYFIKHPRKYQTEVREAYEVNPMGSGVWL